MPCTTEPLAGVIVIAFTAPAATENVALPDCPPAVAVTVALPVCNPVARPLDDTDTTLELELDHVTV